MISASERRAALELIGAATTAGARAEAACEAIGLSLRTYRRWRSQGADGGQDRRPSISSANTSTSTFSRSVIKRSMPTCLLLRACRYWPIKGNILLRSRAFIVCCARPISCATEARPKRRQSGTSPPHTAPHSPMQYGVGTSRGCPVSYAVSSFICTW